MPLGCQRCPSTSVAESDNDQAGEGGLSSSLFVVVSWFRSSGDLCQYNELVARDEALHTRFACILYDHLQSKITESNPEGASLIGKRRPAVFLVADDTPFLLVVTFTQSLLVA